MIERTNSYAKDAIEHYIKEEPEKALGYGILSSESIGYVLWACSYTISNYGIADEKDCIEVEIDYLNSDKKLCLGYYYVLYNYNNGEVIDDGMNMYDALIMR